MRKAILVSFLIGLTICFSFVRHKPSENRKTINTIIGDISFLEKFGHAPGLITDEELRIKTHLEYVEGDLRHKEVSGLSLELQQRRRQVVDLLRDYWQAGVFPRNYDYRNTRK